MCLNWTNKNEFDEKSTLNKQYKAGVPTLNVISNDSHCNFKAVKHKVIAILLKKLKIKKRFFKI